MVIGDNWQDQLTTKGLEVLTLILKLKNYVRLELSGARFSNHDLSSAFLRAPITNCFFFHTNMSRTDMHKTYISKTDFVSCDMLSIYADNVRFDNCNLAQTRLDNSVLNKSKFTSCNVTNDCSFQKVSLCGANFEDCQISNTSFYNANLYRCDFSDSTLESIDFKGAVLDECIFDIHNVRILDKLNEEQVTNVTIDLLTKKSKHYFSTYNASKHIMYKTYKKEFKNYYELKSVLLQSFRPLIEIYLYDENCLADSNIFFTGLKCRLVNIEYSEGEIKIDVDYSDTLRNNQKLLQKTRHSDKHSQLLSFWTDMSSHMNRVASFYYKMNDDLYNRLNCIKVIGRTAVSFMNPSK